MCSTESLRGSPKVPDPRFVVYIYMVPWEFEVELQIFIIIFAKLNATKKKGAEKIENAKFNTLLHNGCFLFEDIVNYIFFQLNNRSVVLKNKLILLS